MVNRILLGYNINPLNDFQFISQAIFTKLRKLMLCENAKKDGKDFLLQYFFLEKLLIKREEFNFILFSVFKKLIKIINLTTIENIFENFKKI